MKKLLFIAAVVVGLACFKADAADYYVSQSGSGTSNGVDAADARPLSWLNNPANWGGATGAIQPGDTVHLVGTLTNGITVSGSGTVSSYITILFEPNASITQPAGNAINLQSYNCITIDGGVNGLIQNTDTGTGLGSQVAANCINGTPTIGNITIQNLTLTNLYVRTSTTDDASCSSSAISLNGSMTNITVRNCSISQVLNGIILLYGPGTASHDWNIYSNTMSYVNWGIGIGDANSDSHVYNIFIHNNSVDHFANWDDTAGDGFHHNGIYTYAANFPSTISNEVVYANMVGPNFGTSSFQTSGIYADGAGTALTSIQAFICHDNIIWATNGGGANDGAIVFGNANNSIIANNTLYINSKTLSGLDINVSTTNCFFVNNLVIGFHNAAVAVDASDWYKHLNGFTSDYNGFYPWDGSTVSILFSDWTGNHKDVDSYNNANAMPALTGNPAVDFSLTNAYFAQAKYAGTNLSAFFTTDYSGNTRTNAGNWDIGAYAFNVAAGSGNVPVVPVVVTNPVLVITNTIPVVTNTVPATTNTVPVVTNTPPPIVTTIASRPATPGGLHAVW